LTSASGWTAKSKGNTALEGALGNLVDSAVELGANAIIGVQAATFGAGGGITNVVGGDAVGVLITGTAVFWSYRSATTKLATARSWRG